MLTAGVRVVERHALGLATVLVRKGKSAELAARVRERFGVELPREPRRAVASMLGRVDMSVGASAGDKAGTSAGPGSGASAGSGAGAGAGSGAGTGSGAGAISHAPYDIAFAGTAPGAWLAMRDDAGADFASSLADALDGLASVADQSDGVIVLRVSGPNVRDMLCKLAPIDVHPRAFPVNQVAVTLAAHMPITMWRLADDASGSAVFEIATFRSFAESFEHALR